MARDRERTDPLSAESRREVLRDGLRYVRAPQFIPYDETPYGLTSVEALKLMGVAASTFGTTFSRMQFVISRAFGKNHAADKLKDIQRGMAIFIQVADEASITTKDLNLTFPKAKTIKPKRQRIPDREPYYVKLTKPPRR